MIIVKAEASDGHMTLAELTEFVARAAASETPPDARVKIRTGGIWYIKTIETAPARTER